MPESWHQYPMGPTLRHVLDFPEIEINQINDPSDEEKAQFEAFLKEHLHALCPIDFDILVNLMEELTGMAMPHLTFQLYEAHPSLHSDLSRDFRAMLNLGVSSLIESEWETSISFLTQANIAEPAELAPFINLAEIYLHIGDEPQAEKWAIAGLNLDPNNRQLWKIIGLISMERGTEIEVQALAKKLNSYAGLSLAADLTDPEDFLLKSQSLENHYHSGGREPDFLIEYTALLGISRQFEKIPPILWDAENLPHFQGSPPWELYLHASQAHAALEDHDKAELILNKLTKRRDLPPQALEEIARLKQEQVSNPTQLS